MWSPMRTTVSAVIIGFKISNSFACVASSTITLENTISFNLESYVPAHVHIMTGVSFRIILSILYFSSKNLAI